MKKTAAILFALILCLAMAVPALAEGGFADEYYRGTDDTDTISYADRVYLNNQLDEIASRQSFDVTWALINTPSDETIEQYVAEIYSEYLYGYGDDKDGVFLVVNAENGEWYVYTDGCGTELFNDERIAAIGEQISEGVASGDYYYALSSYAELCDEYITAGVPVAVEQPQLSPVQPESEPEETDEPEIAPAPQADSKKFEPLPIIYLPICLVIGVVIALVAVGSMKASMKSVHMQAQANNYTKVGSFKVTESQDIFLYRNVERTERPKNNDEEK